MTIVAAKFRVIVGALAFLVMALGVQPRVPSSLRRLTLRRAP